MTEGENWGGIGFVLGVALFLVLLTIWEVCKEIVDEILWYFQERRWEKWKREHGWPL